MAGSQETFGKKEREKKRLQKKKEKQMRKEERKANATKGTSLEDMLVYVDENGHLTDTPPDPTKKKKIKAENIEIGIPKRLEEDEAPTDFTGKVSYYDDSKGFGFIIDSATQEKYFVHVSGLAQEIKENDKVSFKLERGQKGMNAVQVTKI
jgi:cold shock CspA family protein